MWVIAVIVVVGIICTAVRLGQLLALPTERMPSLPEDIDTEYKAHWPGENGMRTRRGL